MSGHRESHSRTQWGSGPITHQVSQGRVDKQRAGLSDSNCNTSRLPTTAHINTQGIQRQQNPADHPPLVQSSQALLFLAFVLGNIGGFPIFRQ